MVGPNVWLATVESGALVDILHNCAADMPHVYLESESRVRLSALADLLATPSRITPPAARWSKGRAFGPTLEIGWRRVDPFLVDLHALNETGRAPNAALTWLASQWNGQLDSVGRLRDVMLIEPAYNQGTILRCMDYRSQGLVVMTRLCDVIDGAKSSFQTV